MRLRKDLSSLCPLVGWVTVAVIGAAHDTWAEEESIGAIKQQLKTVGAAVMHQVEARQQTGKWVDSVVDPYPNAWVPIDRRSVEWMFDVLDRIDKFDDETYWDVAPELFMDLNNIVLSEVPPAVLKLCRSALQKRFPLLTNSAIDGYRWAKIEIALDDAITLLGRLGNDEDLTFLKSAERPEFWAPRLEGKAFHITHRIAREPDGVLLYFQSMVPRNLAYKVPRRAGVVLDEILEKRAESPAYLSYIEELKREADDRVRKADGKLREQQ